MQGHRHLPAIHLSHRPPSIRCSFYPTRNCCLTRLLALRNLFQSAEPFISSVYLTLPFTLPSFQEYLNALGSRQATDSDISDPYSLQSTYSSSSSSPSFHLLPLPPTSCQLEDRLAPAEWVTGLPSSSSSSSVRLRANGYWFDSDGKMLMAMFTGESAVGKSSIVLRFVKVSNKTYLPAVTAPRPIRN